MKRKWSLRLGAAVLCAVLLGSCGGTAAAPAESTAPADPLTGQQLLYPEQRAAAVVIENTVDELTGKQLGFTNLLVCFAGIADYPGNSGGVQQVDYVSGGEAYFFTRGAVQRGTWQKASPEHPLKVYAADGSELCFNRGKTYLAIVDDDEWQNFNYQ